jgi:anthranilate phosphoribosyltransferase
MRKLAASEPLSDGQISVAVEQLIDEKVSPVAKADFLSLLARKGETAEEIAAFARLLRDRAIQPALNSELREREILDVVGTGGDRLSTFNISTATALLAAAAGVLVAKHGNRASTSPIGSADVMEALGIPYDLGPDEAVRSLKEHGFAFFFAPKYHPAFKYIIPARKLCAERGQTTIFNFLGPLLNPARPSAALIGVPRPDLCEPLARVLQTLGVRRAMVVCGRVPADRRQDAVTNIEHRTSNIQHPTLNQKHPAASSLHPTSNIPPPTSAYLDELSTLGESTVAEFYQDRGFSMSAMSASHFPVQPASLADLRGGDRQLNADIIRRILNGKERGPKRDAVLLNGAAALFVAGRARSLTDGWELAADVIDSGQAARKLEELAAR